MHGDAAKLESALQTAWDPEVAAVYADLLTGTGDPRGELIAIDLALRAAPRPALHARKREVFEAWIPEPVRAAFGWQPRHVDRGCLRWVKLHGTRAGETCADQLRVVIERVGDALSELELWGDDAPIARALEVLASQPLPWLRRLHLHRVTGSRAIGDKLWSRVIAATPNLRDLTILGTRVVMSPIHPAVTTLRLDGGTGVLVGKHPIDAVTELDLAFADPDRARGRDALALAPLLNPRTFPALRAIDLSRNEPPRWAPDEEPGVLEFLAAIEDLARIERVRLPAIRDEEAARRVLAVLEGQPRLRIEIARRPRQPVSLPGLVHPRLAPPPDRAWPADAHGRSALAITCAGVPHRDELALSSLIEHLDLQFDAMTADAQAAWVELWSFLDQLPWEDEHGETVTRPFPAATLQCALEALDGDFHADAIAASIRASDPTVAEVRVERYWGW